MGTILLVFIIITLGMTGLGSLLLHGVRSAVRGAKNLKRWLNDETEEE